MNFFVLPPEINSALMFSGAGSGPMLDAAAAWDTLAAELGSASESFSSITADLAAQAWQGPSSQAMMAAAVPYAGFMSSAAAQASGTATQAQMVVGAFESALAATVHPALVEANRSNLVSLVMSNLFGQNAPAIAEIEGAYEELWAQDVTAMVGYHAGVSAAAAQLISPAAALQNMPNYGNVGNGNVGFFNTGNYNFGINNTGALNFGIGNLSPIFDVNPSDPVTTFGGFGLFNHGIENVGALNTGLENVGLLNNGTLNLGIANTGTNNSGLPLSFLTTLGTANHGNFNQGLFNTGNYNIGIGLTGDHLTGMGPLHISNAGPPAAAAAQLFSPAAATQNMNWGYGNVGNGNIGFFNTGTLNLGIGNLSPNFDFDPNHITTFGGFGIGNNGLEEVGGWNTGMQNVGLFNNGTLNLGIANTGTNNSGLPLSFLQLFGTANHGNFNQGLFNTGNYNIGIGLTGDHQIGIGPLHISN